MALPFQILNSSPALTLRYCTCDINHNFEHGVSQTVRKIGLHVDAHRVMVFKHPQICLSEVSRSTTLMSNVCTVTHWLCSHGLESRSEKRFEKCDWDRDLNYVHSHALQTPSQSRSGSAHARIKFRKSFAFACPRIRLSRQITIQNALILHFKTRFKSLIWDRFAFTWAKIRQGPNHVLKRLSGRDSSPCEHSHYTVYTSTVGNNYRLTHTHTHTHTLHPHNLIKPFLTITYLLTRVELEADV